ncbi:MAG: hypothetical protein A2107_05765 [Verrucomicrobia bacterium GWF2_62_7]|nr:MAG: hypothetical protein A2107_05765 [Verrucomicrobia bacterium GWF2_62_7]
MFGAIGKSENGPKALEALNSYLGEGSEFKGSLTFQGAMRIDGVFEGELITTGQIAVGEKARVKADIVGTTITVAGQIEGNITAKERVDLKPTARVVGDIKSPVLSIGEGVILEGKCIIDRSGAGPLAAKL